MWGFSKIVRHLFSQRYIRVAIKCLYKIREHMFSSDLGYNQ